MTNEKNTAPPPLPAENPSELLAAAPTAVTDALVVVGSLHYDILVEATHTPAKGETVAGHVWFPKFGGKGGNQAIAAKSHGADTRFVSATGKDNFADYLNACMAEVDLLTSYVEQLDNAATGMSVAIQDSDGDYGAVIVSGANLCIDPDVLETPALWNNASYLLLQNEVSESLNQHAAEIARKQGTRVCLNAAPARHMSAEFLSLIDILIVNAIEAEELCDLAVDSLPSASAAAQELAKQFPVAIVTAGGEGVAVAQAEGEHFELPAKPVDVVSTHGAGDMFCGVLCAELVAGATLNDAVRIANGCAADHVGV